MNELLTIDVLSRTFDDLPTGVGIFYVHDLNDLKSIEYVYMNKIILHEMRKTKEETFGKKIIEVAPEAYQHPVGLQVIETYRNVAAGGESVNLGVVEYSNHLVAGKYECSVHHITGKYVYVALRNVTQLEAKKIELEAKNKELSQFAYVASHDLKDPINTFRGCIEIIQNTLQDTDEETNKLLEYMADASRRMVSVINTLLDYSKLGEGKEMKVVDCNELIETVKKDMDHRISESNTIIHAGDLPTIQGYETELQLLFQNLISNAIKFQKPGSSPEIKISAAKEKDWVFQVEDNGIGIAPENLDRIFTMFQRLHNKEDYEGSGIGLAHCKKIVELHKGEIWVKSIPGEGSTFYFSLPSL